jgi:type I restriction enzyme S subunit
VTEIDPAELPGSWSVASLAEIAEINPGLAKAEIDDDLDVTFVPMPAVEAETGKIDVSATRKFSQVKKGYTAFQEGDVLFAKITPCMENGKMGVVPALTNGLGFGSTEFHVLRPFAGADGRYIYYFVSSLRFRHDAEHNMTGAVGQRRVPTPYLTAQIAPLPPTREQTRIVAKIEELFSELDDGVESLKIVRQQLKVYRQAVLKNSFEGKLTAHWRDQNEIERGKADRLIARIKEDRNAHYGTKLSQWTIACSENGSRPSTPKSYSSLGRQVLDDLPRLPEGWAWEKLGWMTCGVEYGTAAKSSKSGAVPVLRMGNIQNARIDWADLVYTSGEDEIRKYSLRDGDVLFNRTNSPELVGKTAIYRGERPALFAAYLIRINQIPAIVDSQYLNLFLNSHIARQYGNRVKTDGVNQSNINGEKLTNYPFPYCSLSEQREIVKLLEEKLSIVDQMEEDTDCEIQKAESLRQSILKKAFSGKLVAQDDADEPASFLLDRIKVEKTEKENGKKKNGRRKAA